VQAPARPGPELELAELDCAAMHDDYVERFGGVGRLLGTAALD
jgi:hypothetical protein